MWYNMTMKQIFSTVYGINDVNDPRGAPKGRAQFDDGAQGPVTGARLPLDGGGYDPGGAYWGGGQVWMFRDGGEALRFYTAGDTFAEARDYFLGQHPRFAGAVEENVFVSAFSGALHGLLVGTTTEDDETGEQTTPWEQANGADEISEASLERLRGAVERFVSEAGADSIRGDAFGAGFYAVMTALGHGVGFGDDPERWSDPERLEAAVATAFGVGGIESGVEDGELEILG